MFARAASSLEHLPPAVPSSAPAQLLAQPKRRTDLDTWDVIHRRLLKMKLGYKAGGVGGGELGPGCACSSTGC